MRSTNENDAFYAWVALKDKRVHNKAIVGIAGQDIPCRRTDGFLPHRRSNRHYLSVSEYSAHAVTDDNTGTMVRIKFVRFGQLLPQAEGGIKNGRASRISEDPELVAFPYLWICLQPVDRLYPGKRA